MGREAGHYGEDQAATTYSAVGIDGCGPPATNISDRRRAVPSRSGLQHLPEIPYNLWQSVAGRNCDLIEEAAKRLPGSIVVACGKNRTLSKSQNRSGTCFEP